MRHRLRRPVRQRTLSGLQQRPGVDALSAGVRNCLRTSLRASGGTGNFEIFVTLLKLLLTLNYKVQLKNVINIY